MRVFYSIPAVPITTTFRYLVDSYRCAHIFRLPVKVKKEKKEYLLNSGGNIVCSAINSIFLHITRLIFLNLLHEIGRVCFFMLVAAVLS